jgi:hypothetical protein
VRAKLSCWVGFCASCESLKGWNQCSMSCSAGCVGRGCVPIDGRGSSWCRADA